MNKVKKVLVTGASGYIGIHVVKELLDQGYHVIANDVYNNGIDERAEFIDIPIFQKESNLYELLGKPECLIHLAWKDGFVHNSNAHMDFLSDHMIFLRKMIDSGVKLVSVMGSMHEVGYWEGMVDENTPCNPMSSYAIAKNSLRQALLLYSSEKDVSLHWLRGYYIYGDDKRGHSIFAKLCKSAEEGKTTFPFTSGKNKYDFLSIEEVSKQIVKASLQTEVNGVINICSGKPVSLGEEVEHYIHDNGLNIKLEYGAYPDRKYDSPAIWGDNSKIKKIMEKLSYE